MYTFDDLISRLQIAFAAMDGNDVAEAINSLLCMNLRYDGDGTWSERPTDRVFVITPTRDGDAYQVCSTRNRYGALVLIFGQDDYEVLEQVSSMEEAAAYCAARYGVDKVETI
jgi:hypothetical protein